MNVKDVEIVVTEKRTELAGTVIDGRNVPVADYAGVIFSTDEQKWRLPQSRFIASVRPDQQGQFRSEGLPPGDYYVAAVDYLETGEERDPELLAKLAARATRVKLAEGAPATVTLKLGTVD